MSVFADFFMSRDDEAPRYDTAPGRFPGSVQHKGITPLELSTLWAIIRGVDWDVASMDAFACLLDENEGQRMVHRLPASMVGELSMLTAAQIADAAAKWATTEELDWLPEEARPVIEDLARLARHASESGRSVYVWNCV